MRVCRSALAIACLCWASVESAAQACTGDVDRNGRISVSELILGVNVALGHLPLEEALAFDSNGSGTVDISELVAAVGFALRDCPPTPTRTTAPVTPTMSPTPAVRSGLVAVDHERIPDASGSTPHAAYLLVSDRLYVANSGGVVAYDISADGLSLHYTTDTLDQDPVRCTSVARHAASRRLYCAAVDRADLSTLDADTGVLVSDGNLFSLLSRGYRDIHIIGNTLYLAGFDAGLLRAQIDPDGNLAELESFIEGEIVEIEGDESRLVLLDRNTGLRVFEDGLEVRSIPLHGPMLGLSLRGNVAAVAKGSEGAQLVDVDTGSSLKEARPPCVAVDADYHEGALAIACTSGTYVYRTEPNPRTAGWVPAAYASLNVRFIDDLLVANDWWSLTSYRVDPEGRALGLDAPRGFLLERGEGIRFAVRNPDDQPQHLDGELLAPHGQIFIDVPPNDDDEVIVLRTQEQGPSAAVKVKIARGKPRATFDSIFPIALASRYVSFVQPDCALQFPAIEDLYWLSSQGTPPSGLAPLILLVTFNDRLSWPVEGFLRLWGDTPTEAARVVDVAPQAQNSNDFFEENLGAHRFIPGADTTVEFSIDQNGRIAGFDRVYRGAYPLAATRLESAPIGPAVRDLRARSAAVGAR